MPTIDYSKLPGTFTRDVDSDWFPWPFPGPGADAIRIKVRRSDHPDFLAWARAIDKDGVMTRAGAKASKAVTVSAVRNGFRQKKKSGKVDPEVERQRAEEELAEQLSKALEDMDDEEFVKLGDPHLPAVGVALYKVETIEGIEGADKPGMRLALFGFSGVLDPDGNAITLAELAERGDAFRAQAAGDPNFETIAAGWRYEDGSPMVVSEGEYIGLSVDAALRAYVGKCAEELAERRSKLFAQVDSDSPGSADTSDASSAA